MRPVYIRNSNGKRYVVVKQETIKTFGRPERQYTLRAEKNPQIDFKTDEHFLNCYWHKET